MTTKVDVRAIRARAGAATAGPWRFERGEQHTEGMADAVYQHIASGPWGVADTYHAPPIAIEGFGQMSGYIPPRHGKVEDAEFIAAARTDVPALCDRVEALEAALEKLLDDEHNQTAATWDAARATLEGE